MRATLSPKKRPIEALGFPSHRYSVEHPQLGPALDGGIAITALTDIRRWQFRRRLELVTTFPK